MIGKRTLATADDEPWRSAQHNRELARLWPLLGRHIAFHRRLVDLTANVKAALLLSQAIYWTRHGRDVAMNDGWFFKTSEQWMAETGLSAREQATARELLRLTGVLDERRLGVPARLHYRLEVDQLGALLLDGIGRSSSRLDWTDAATIAELLGPSLAFHRALAGVAGGVHAGLLLSRALYLTRLRLRRQLDAWIAASAADWTRDIGLTRREQEAARRDLIDAGLWEESLAGIPPRLAARVRLEGLLARVVGDVSVLNPGVAAASPPVSGIPAISPSPNVESSLWPSRMLDLRKAPNQIRRNRHHSSAESAKLLIQRSTSVLVQQPTAVARPDAKPVSWCDRLIFPDALLPDERASARRLLERYPDIAQAMLDELSARMQAKAIRIGPIAYLRGLVKRAEAGDFIPELGPRVAADRRRREAESIRRQEAEAEEQRRAAERATPEYQAKFAERREKVRQMLDVIGPKSTKGRPL